MQGWQYDHAGNLRNDTSSQYQYDALGRVTSIANGGTTCSNSYHGDGVLVQQDATRYTQDLAAPLSQILSDGTQRSVYGNPAERLFAQQGSSARTWYATDALGSVRATLNDAGVPQAVAGYDAWGVLQSAAIAPFGFTGELQQGSDGWLRARWYGAGRGGFGGRDAWQGEAQRPYSLMPYQYAYAAPTMWMDASGECPEPPASMGKHVICMALFIQPPEIPVKYSNIILHGDNRGFNNNSSPGQSRGYIWINTDTGIAESHMNPTGYILLVPVDGLPPSMDDCQPYPGVQPTTIMRTGVIWAQPSTFNSWKVKKTGDTIKVDFDLVLAGILERFAPHINGTVTFYREYVTAQGDYRFAAYGERDGFPWAEEYYHDGSGSSETIFQRPAVRGDPEDLNAIEGSYPYGWIEQQGYTIRQSFADPYPRKDSFGYRMNISGPY